VGDEHQAVATVDDLWHRVETASAGPTAQQAACGQPASTSRSVSVYRLGRVLRTARRLRAGRRQGAELCLVEADAATQQPGRPTVGLGLGTRSLLDRRAMRLGPGPGPCRSTHRLHRSNGKQQRVNKGNHTTARHAAGRPHGSGRRRHQLPDRLPCPDSHCAPRVVSQSALITTRNGEQESGNAQFRRGQGAAARQGGLARIRLLPPEVDNYWRAGESPKA